MERLYKTEWREIYSMKYKHLNIKEVRYSTAPDSSIAVFIFARDTITGQYNVYFGSRYNHYEVDESKYEDMGMEDFEVEEIKDIEYIINYGSKFPFDYLKSHLNLLIKYDVDKEIGNAREKIQAK